VTCRRIAAATRSSRRRDAAAARGARRRCTVRRIAAQERALVDLPSKEGVTPLMAAAGVEFGDRVTRGRNRTNDGVLATMKLLLDGARTSTPEWWRSLAQSSRRSVDQASQSQWLNAGPARVPTARPCRIRPALHGAAQRGFTPFVKFLASTARISRRRMPADGPRSTSRKGVGVAGVRQASREPFPRNRRPARNPFMAAKGIAVTKTEAPKPAPQASAK
jgi:hypothetical protein